ncbi:A/G-specific adenine glycosylase [Actinomycetospora straminea]|uniref:Adenine DNA glycosylase n=1 Tax=Actinomycetospora straminea TaxID=663607 RepID=A0ABP9EC40_9PSEU|nr:A/G-specific adenine glycosylase [Actinomycetospora straminea]MDD7931890.1 A/G-specific adenine glycosylase [Actinomycetospora straminea]
MGTTTSAAAAPAADDTPLADVLVPWFRAHARDLPWRRPGTTPWGVLVSEIMLQQTPVARVEEPWRAWLERWPRPSAMAAAPAADVLRAWGKLGYPRRALRLHAAAQAIAADHDDVVPTDVDTLESLPGIGTYTARAVAAFAHGQRVPVVDTNVRRVVARAVHGRAGAGPAASRDLADVEALLPGARVTSAASDAADVTLAAPLAAPRDEDAATMSAALMELGATVCVARGPRCGGCPVVRLCAWQRLGRPAWDGPVPKAQTWAGTDRQVRGRLLDVLRGAPGPVTAEALEKAWLTDPAQRSRCLDSLLVDGLVEQLADGRFALPGEAGDVG